MIDLLLWPVLVFAFYKKKTLLKTLIFIWLICFSIIGSLVTAEYMFFTLLFRVIFVPIYCLSALAVAWGIKRWKSKREQTNETNHLPQENKVTPLIVDELSKSNKINYDPQRKTEPDPHAKYKPPTQREQ